ncbi:MAG TPA: S9 family peptidase, partial [Acidobacteriota bacterium]|nr:S9 family peptidase [Acidobacteriota bacterium]
MKILVTLGFVLSICSSALAAHPFQVEDMQKISRIADPQLSPDGKWVAFMVQKSDVAQNKAVQNLWIMSSTGGDPHQLTFAEKGTNSRPRWSPDSTSLYFISDRASDVPQIFQLNLAGGEARQVTKFSTGVDSFLLSPDGKTLAISASVFPECSDLACNEKKQKEVDDNKAKVRVINTIPFRRWDSWVEGKRNHIFVMPVAGGDAKDITPG